jgi:TonB-like protein
MRTVHLFVLVVAVGLCKPAVTQCRVPGFKIGQNFSNPEQGIGSLSVSLQPKDFTVQKLACLCQILLKKNPQWKKAGVEMFTSKDAAGNMSHMLVEPPPEAKRWKKELHASYSFNKSIHQNQLEIIPFGFRGPASLNTTMNLPLTTPPHCQVEIGKRCLTVALQEIDYPQEALKLRASGKVTVAAVIDRKGGIRQLRVVSADIHPANGNVLANAALRDLSGWRFDSGDRDEDFQIGYSFEITTPDPFYRAETSVSFSLPNEVDVRVSPWSIK